MKGEHLSGLRTQAIRNKTNRSCERCWRLLARHNSRVARARAARRALRSGTPPAYKHGKLPRSGQQATNASFLLTAVFVKVEPAR
jgi:hypothetical protein